MPLPNVPNTLSDFYEVRFTKPEQFKELIEFESGGLRYTLMPYKAPPSPIQRGSRDSPKHRPKFDLTTNEQFYVTWVLPLAIHKPANVLFMYNGLNEVGRKHFMHYDALATHVARRNVAVCILPTPFHLNRATRPLGRARPDLPSKQLFRRPLSILVNYQRSLTETRSILALIKGDEEGFRSETRRGFNAAERKLKANFSRKNIVPHLFGFSLGGLRALTGFAIAPKEFNTCILLSSGTRIQDINPSDIVDRAEWDAFTADLLSNFDFVNIYRPRDKRTILQRVRDTALTKVLGLDDIESIVHVLGGGGTAREVVGLSAEQLRRVLFLIGGKDPVMPLEGLRRFQTSAEGLNVLQVQNLEHLVRESSAWFYWNSTLASLMVDFILNTEPGVEGKPLLAAAFIQWQASCFRVYKGKSNVSECAVTVGGRARSLSIPALTSLLRDVLTDAIEANEPDYVKIIALINDHVRKFSVSSVALELLYVRDTEVINGIARALRTEGRASNNEAIIAECQKKCILTDYQAEIVKGHLDALIRQAEVSFSDWYKKNLMR